ncbi:transglycosylase domain-containing protein [Salicibibacter kimchii]|uniref:Penicillin-binding protein n=1 Tax=Salicibibacter kimchii TaxID=2099786 RepID=A0A345BYF6_9BACI|nr:transglycosylase domain-containing protein [Salicibibacter kimchii]AXF55987.1 penicillin-binding protein [Salicibibacter kimchii]
MKRRLQRLNDWLGHWDQTKIGRPIDIAGQVLWNLFLIMITTALISMTFVGASGLGYFVSLVEDAPAYSEDEMKADLYNYEQTSEVYFAGDTYLGELPSILDRREVPLDHVSDYVIQAMIATEDEYFYEHSGIVPKAIMRAAFQEIAGSGMQTGGSTLTQQVVKNQLLSNEVSFNRKAREMMLAMRLENYLDKDEILEVYLNVVPFGRDASGTQIAGVQTAAQGVFGVDASELNLPQAAFIAGLPQNPFTFTPFTPNGDVRDDLSAGINRMEKVLSRMHEKNIIDDDRYEEALAYDIENHFTHVKDTKRSRSMERYPYMTNEIERRASLILRDLLLEKANIDIAELDREAMENFYDKAKTQLRLGGYRIHTTIDKNSYDAMNTSIKDDSLFGPNRGDMPEEIGATLIENESGAILSFVGGRNFERENLNHATQGQRSVGSTIKPLMPYGSAMERGIVQPATALPDMPSTYSDGTALANNRDNYLGFLPVRDALMYSQNVPSVKTFQLLEQDEVQNDLQNMGFFIDGSHVYESASLGAIDATVEQNTSAMSLFGNDGKRQDPYMIERVETHEGDVIYEHEPESTLVFSPRTSYLAVDMMRDVIKSGTADFLPEKLAVSGDWAGKTGTSTDYHDAWFIGLNPKVTLGVWIGYDDPQPLERQYNGITYSQRTQALWATMMNAAAGEDHDRILSNQRFHRPDGIVRATMCGVNGLLPSIPCHNAGLVYTDLMNETHAPTKKDDSREERYVTISGQNYPALEDTPEAFTAKGIVVDHPFFDQMNHSKHEDDGLLGDVIPAESKTPTSDHPPEAVSGVRTDKGALYWDEHPDDDIVGYRIYEDNGKFVVNVIGNTTTTYKGVDVRKNYEVTAVDTKGRESL